MSKQCPYNTPIKSKYTMILIDKKGNEMIVENTNLNKLLLYKDDLNLTGEIISTTITGSDMYLYEGDTSK